MGYSWHLVLQVLSATICIHGKFNFSMSKIAASSPWLLCPQQTMHCPGTLRSAITQSDITHPDNCQPDIIIHPSTSTSRLRCCLCPILWGWQHRALFMPFRPVGQCQRGHNYCHRSSHITDMSLYPYGIWTILIHPGNYPPEHYPPVLINIEKDMKY